MSMPVLEDLLTPDQLQLFLAELGDLLRSGYGELAILVKAGRPLFLRVTRSIELPRPERDVLNGGSANLYSLLLCTGRVASLA